MGPLGTWMVYSALTDVAMRPYYDRQMASAGYLYGPRPVVGMSGVLMGLLILGGLGVVVGGIVVFGRKT